MRHHTCTQRPMAYAYQPQLMILIYGRRRDVLLGEQKHHHGSSFSPRSVGSTIAHLQTQKPAMFAQMPLSVYRHFTGAVCTTSSDGRFASGLSNSSDMVRSPTFRSRSQLNWRQVRRRSVGHHAPCETGLCKSRPVAPRDVAAPGKVKGAPRPGAGCKVPPW
jgi:hypothetical protein